MAVLLLGGWAGVADESLVVVVNRSGAPVRGVVWARESLPFALGRGERRRFILHQARASDADFRISVHLGSGKTVSAEGPYHHAGTDFAFDGPDEETIVVLSPDGLEIADVGQVQRGGAGEIAHVAGYEPDQRLLRPSGGLEAIVRVGPSLTSDRAWRVLIATPDAAGLSGSTVFQAHQAEGVSVRWASDKDLVVRAVRPTGGWTHPFSLVMTAKNLQLVHTRVERVP